MTRAVQPHIITDDSAHSGKVIGGSLLLSRAFNDYLIRTPSSTGNQKVWTFSAWIKPHSTHSFSGTNHIWGSYGNNDGIAAIYFQSSKIYTYFDTSGSNPYGSVNDRLYRDPTAWYHLVWRVDANNTTQRIWVNGDEESLSSSLNPPNFSYSLNQSGQPNALGTAPWSTSNSADIYITEVHHIDGTLYDANHFGFFESSTGNWVPKSSEVIKANTTYGTNGFYLPLDGTDFIGTDKSGNNNNFYPNKSSLNAVHDLSKATGALPIFKTNTGGTQKASFNDVREDPFKSYIEAAVPLVSGTRYDVRDYSADVKGSGTNKTCTVSGTDVSDRNIAFAGPSRYFDGDDDQVYISQDSSFNIGTGDFCIEGWYNAISFSSTGYYKRLWCLGNQFDSILIDVNYNNYRFEFRYNNTTVVMDGGSDGDYLARTYQWQHVALVRQSGTWKMYVDGRMIASSTTAGNTNLDYNRSNHRLTIGRISTSTDSNSVASSFNGYISDFRYYKGTCKYTGNFIPPKPYGDGQNQASLGGWVTPDTPSGTAVGRLPDNVRFTSGSVCFDGIGDNVADQSALSIADSNDFYFDADFTMECYAFRGIAPATVSGVFGQWVSSGGTDRNVQLYWFPNGTLAADMNRSGTNYRVTSDEIKACYWNHIALVLQGSTLRLYVNGVQVDSITVSGAPNNATKPFFIGAESNSSSQSIYS